MTDGRQRPTGRQVNRELDFVLRGHRKAVRVVESPDKRLGGKWIVIESTTPDHGKFVIEWDYRVEVTADGSISGRGNKIRVNGKPAREGERNTWAEFTVRLRGTQASGPVRERALNGHEIPGRWDLQFSPDFRTFEGRLYDRDTLVSTLTGYAMN